jgi:thiamine-phosphate pyrophosphorylase
MPSRKDDILRILDANLNRAREALRVIEEYHRLGCDDGTGADELRSIRHGLVEFQKKAGLGHGARLGARDAEGDVGRPLKTGAVQTYGAMSDLLVANFSRLQEALRVLAEYARLSPRPEAARIAEDLRFRVYGMESDGAVHAPRRALLDAALYFVLSGELGPAQPARIAGAAARGGADVVQLRGFDLPDRSLVALAREVGAAVREAGALYVVNDRLDVALAVEADGVHLGESDVPFADARRVAPRRFIVGATVGSAGEAVEALEAGADYAGIGAVFPSPVKPGRRVIGPEEAARAARAARGPVFPIGGIGPDTIEELLSAGLDRACVSSALQKSPDPAALAATLKAKLLSARSARGAGREDNG